MSTALHPDGDRLSTIASGSENAAWDNLRQQLASVAIPFHDTPRFPRLVSTFDFPVKSHYRLKEFLVYHDIEFIQAIYLGVLHRLPDSGGLEIYLSALRSGTMSKVDLISTLRYSTEGRGKAILIKGLSFAKLTDYLHRVPIFGYLFGILKYVIRLPHIIKRLAQCETYNNHMRHELVGVVNQLTDTIAMTFEREQSTNRSSMIGFSESVNQLITLSQQVTKKVDFAQFESLSTCLEMVKADKADRSTLEKLEREIKALEQVKVNCTELDAMSACLETMQQNKAERAETLLPIAGLLQQTQYLEQELNKNYQQLAQLIADVRWEIPTRATLPAIDDLPALPHLDDFYFLFEERFRGSRELIRQRAEIYLPIIKDSRAGTAETPILDIGCGRGEWLELLHEQGYIAFGIDTSAAMVSAACSLGLQVQHIDVIEFLRGQPTDSFGAITGFHIVEHLPFTKLICLIDEICRVLRPGGVLIFETPNPENLTVGACNFYLDPTHRNPIPPGLLQFIVEARSGFERVEILPLTEHRGLTSLQTLNLTTPGADALNPVIDLIQHRLLAAPDYAVIGF